MLSDACPHFGILTWESKENLSMSLKLVRRPHQRVISRTPLLNGRNCLYLPLWAPDRLKVSPLVQLGVLRHIAMAGQSRVQHRPPFTPAVELRQGGLHEGGPHAAAEAYRGKPAQRQSTV